MGGMGFLHYNMTAEEQVQQAKRVKQHVPGFVARPATLAPQSTIAAFESLKVLPILPPFACCSRKDSCTPAAVCRMAVLSPLASAPLSCRPSALFDDSCFFMLSHYKCYLTKSIGALAGCKGCQRSVHHRGWPGRQQTAGRRHNSRH